MTRTFSSGDVREYVDLTGDGNPAYDRLLPSALIGGMFSKMLGTELPGRGTNWLKQRTVLGEPAFVGETLTATLRVVRVRPEKGLVNLSTVCTGDRGRVVWEGEALVLCKEMEARV